MDFARALTYPFDDPDWLKKLGIGVLIFIGGAVLGVLIIPAILMGLVMLGWRYEIMKRVRNNDPTPLPDWSDLGGLLNMGFKLAVAQIVYQIPTILFACVVTGVSVLPALGAGNEDLAGVLAGTAGVVIACCSCIIILYAIAAAVVYWGGVIRFIDHEELSTFFEFGDNFAIVRDNIGEFGMALLYVILIGAIASVASSITAGLGSLVSPIFTQYSTGHVLGQLARQLGGSSVESLG